MSVREAPISDVWPRHTPSSRRSEIGFRFRTTQRTGAFAARLSISERRPHAARPGRTWHAAAVAILLAAALSGCAGRGACDPIQPRLLPDGSLPGDPTVEIDGDGVVVVTWASSDGQRVTERIVRPDAAGRAACPPNEVPLEMGCFRPDEQTTVGDRPAVFMAADAGLTSAVTMAFVEGPCVCEITVGPGYSHEQVKAYAAGI
jgi:hypothetical protein